MKKDIIDATNSAIKYNNKFNELTRSLIKSLPEIKNRENVVFSPMSVIMLLGITTESVGGKTRDEIMKVLGEKYSYENLRSILCDMQILFSSDEKLTSSNAVCLKEEILKSVNPAYEKKLEDFGGKLFATKDIVKEVNTWVKEKTRGMITDVANDSMKEMLACLLNAVAFDAEWMEEYEDSDIDDDVFNNADGTTSNVQMMYSTEYSYLEDGYFRGFAKMYKDGEYSFVALLPKKKVPTFINRSLDKLDIPNLLKTSRYIKTFVTMPEFTCDYGTNLTGLFKDMGIDTAFSAEADFTPLTNEWVKLDSIIHKAHIEVDRKGTRAAAVTMGIVCAGCVPMEEEYKTIILDRPFIYAIVHHETKLPVFVGMMNHA